MTPDRLTNAMRRFKPLSAQEIKTARPGTLINWYDRMQWSIVECAYENRRVPKYVEETHERLRREMFVRMLSGDG